MFYKNIRWVVNFQATQPYRNTQKGSPAGSQNPSKMPPDAPKRFEGEPKLKNLNFLATSPSQHAKKGARKGSRNLARTPPEALTRVESATENNVMSGQPGKRDFLRMYYTESQFLEVPRRSQKASKTTKSGVETLCG